MRIMFQSVTVELTQKCNLNCVYCYNYWKNPRYPSHEAPVSYNNQKKLLKRVLKTIDTGHVVFTGGEPFALEYLLDLCLLVRMKRKRVSIISNGSNEDTALYKNLLQIGIRNFMLPLHSKDPDIHDHMTRIPGSWRKSFASINTISSFGGTVSAAIVVTKLNYSQIRDTIKLLHDIGVKRIMLDRLTLSGEALNNPDIIPSRVELIEAFTSADRVAMEDKIDIRSNICTPICILDPSRFANIHFSVCPNAGTVVSPLIGWEGNIRACTVSPTVIGNIYKDEIENILNSEYFKHWKEPPAYCADCDRFTRCYAGCRAAVEQSGFGLANADPIIDTMT